MKIFVCIPNSCHKDNNSDWEEFMRGESRVGKFRFGVLELVSKGEFFR